MDGVRAGGLGKSMFWAVVSYLVTTLGTLLANYLTPADVSPLAGAIISTAVGLTVVIITVLLDRAKNASAKIAPAQPQPYPHAPATGGAQQYPHLPVGGGAQPYPPAPASGGAQPHPGGGHYQPTPASGGRRKGWISGVAATVIILVLCGVGGLGVTYGAQVIGGKAVAWFEEVSKPDWEKKAEEEGTQRLSEPASKRNGVLTVTVTGVEVTARATKVAITAASTSDDTIRLPDFGSCQISIPGAATLKPDPAAGDWAGDVPPGGELTGTIVFDGTIPPSAGKVTLTFTSIFGGFDAPRSISVDVALNTNS